MRDFDRWLINLSTVILSVHLISVTSVIWSKVYCENVVLNDIFTKSLVYCQWSFSGSCWSLVIWNDPFSAVTPTTAKVIVAVHAAVMWWAIDVDDYSGTQVADAAAERHYYTSETMKSSSILIAPLPQNRNIHCIKNIQHKLWIYHKKNSFSVGSIEFVCGLAF